MAKHHIVAMLLPAWGHTISYIYVAVQMISKDPALVVTILQHNTIVSQMEAELATCSYDKTRLRVIGVGDKEFVDLDFHSRSESPIRTEEFEECFRQLVTGWMENIPHLCQGTNGWPKPQTIHLDVICGGLVIEETKKIVGPESREIFSDEERRNGRSIDDILLQVTLAWNGSDKLTGAIVKFPGAPNMYDHERTAYGAGPPEGFAPILLSAHALAKAADGYIVPTSACFEPIAVPYCRELYKRSRQELFTVGMQTRALCGRDFVPVALTNEVLKSFLGNAVESHDRFFFPTATPHLIKALLNTLLNLVKPFPFVLALGGEIGSPAQGTHPTSQLDRQSSISESLAEGVPLIIWPVGGEQPVNAAFLSSGPDPVAFELLQIRTGPQLGPSLRGGPKITGTVEDAAEEFRATFEAARECITRSCTRGRFLDGRSKTANVRKLQQIRFQNFCIISGSNTVSPSSTLPIPSVLQVKSPHYFPTNCAVGCKERPSAAGSRGQGPTARDHLELELSVGAQVRLVPFHVNSAYTETGKRDARGLGLRGVSGGREAVEDTGGDDSGAACLGGPARGGAGRLASGEGGDLGGGGGGRGGGGTEGEIVEAKVKLPWEDCAQTATAKARTVATAKRIVGVWESKDFSDLAVV
ncbi:hypothetical protein B0H14DRAFT_3756049 [Mycena olivaceomarginata]|nr:hypothetical protein B0H14DRAFT_3756049 [Mycena olivaceomarginata]